MRKKMNKQNLKKNHFRKESSLFIMPACFCIAVLGNLFFGGCAEMAGYSNQSLFPQDIDTVYLEMFDNQTFRRGAEYDLSDALSKRIEVDTPYKIVSSRESRDKAGGVDLLIFFFNSSPCSGVILSFSIISRIFFLLRWILPMLPFPWFPMNFYFIYKLMS